MNDVVFVLVRPSAVGEVYGGERSTISTASALAADGVRSHFIVTSDDDMIAALDAARLTHEVVPVGDPFEALRAAPWREQIARVRNVAAVNKAVYSRVRSTGAPIVHVARIPGVVCAWFGARFAGARLIYHVRGTSRTQRTTWYEVFAMLVADRTIAISDALKGSLVSTAHPLARRLLSRRIDVVFNGFDFAAIDRFLEANERRASRAALGIPEDEVTVLVVGGIFEMKGQLRFIERVLPALAAAVPPVRVTFVGGVKEQGYYQACLDALDRLGLRERVRFTGFIPLTEVYRWYSAADLSAIPSVQEGLSRTAVEAQASGLPVVSTRCVGPEDVIHDGSTGYLVSNEQVQEMIEPLVRLCRDATLRHRLGKAGAEGVRHRFDIARHHSEIRRIYGELTGSASPRASAGSRKPADKDVPTPNTTE